MDEMMEERRSNSAEPGAETAAAHRLMRLATYAAVAVASLLVSVKLAAWLATESVSMLSTMIDSLLDVGASTVNLLAVRHALQPADTEHRFGHGKAEPLAGLAQAAFISGSALFLLFEAGDRLLHPRAIANTEIGYWVMGLSIVLTVCLVAFQRVVSKRTGSVAIEADSMHYKMDVLVNISVIASLYIASEYGLLYADPLFALAIAGYIFWGAWEVGMQSLHLLMDRELPDAERSRIKEIALSHPDVLGLHDLRTRSSGQQAFIQLHLEMEGEMLLSRAHVIAEEVMYQIEAAFPNAEVLIHQDPEGIDERRLDKNLRRDA